MDDLIYGNKRDYERAEQLYRRVVCSRGWQKSGSEWRDWGARAQ